MPDLSRRNLRILFVMDSPLVLMFLLSLRLGSQIKIWHIRLQITLPGYKLLDHPRTERSGGGTALLFRDNITVHKVDCGERWSFPNGYYNIAPVN
jgi:hypothetical protein